MNSLLLALADGAAPAAGGPPGGGLAQFGFIIPMFLIFYFLLIRPQQKKQKEHQDWQKGLQKEDEVVTSGGLVGKIKGMTEHVVTLELQEKVRVRVLRTHIAGKAPTPGAAPKPDANK